MSKKEKVKRYTRKRIEYLVKHRETGIGKATLAKLRRGIGKVPGELPELWGAFLNEMPEELYTKSGEPSYAEWAIYISLTMFALHQQGSANSVHEISKAEDNKSTSLGKVAAKLMDANTDEERERVMHRFAPIITAKDMPELSNHLRGFIQLCKAKSITIDYVKLAGDLYDFQYPNERRKVQLRWGQDFYWKEQNEQIKQTN